MQDNQIGQAAAQHKQIIQDLQKVLGRVELATEQLARLEDAVKHLHRQEQNVLDQTRRIDALQQTAGRLTRAQVLSLRELARLQESLRADTARLSEHMAGAAAFSFALSAAGDPMGQAAKMLDGRQTDAATQQAEQTALDRLALVLEALKPEQPGNPNDSGNPGAGGQGNQAPPGGARTVEELKLLKLLQQEVNGRTRQLHETIGSSRPLTAGQRQEFSSLAEGQGRLADLVIELLPPDQGNKAVPEKLRQELGRAAVSEDESPLLGIAEQMRAVQGRIVEKDAGPKTQDMQKDIVARLDRLLEQVRKSAQRSPASSNLQANSRQHPGQPNSPPKPGTNTNKPTKNPAVAANAQPTRTRPGQPDVRQPELPYSQLPGWGSLPKHQQDQFLQIPGKILAQVPGHDRRLLSAALPSAGRRGLSARRQQQFPGKN